MYEVTYYFDNGNKFCMKYDKDQLNDLVLVPLKHDCNVRSVLIKEVK